MNPQDRQALLNRLRSIEREVRAQGLFDAAVAMQRQADYIESGGSPGLCPYSCLDRGIAGPLVFDTHAGWLRVYSADLAVSIGFTTDRAGALLLLLVAYLKVTPAELRDLAGSIEVTPLSLDDIPEAGER